MPTVVLSHQLTCAVLLRQHNVILKMYLQDYFELVMARCPACT